MAAEIITKEDLDKFRIELVSELKSFLQFKPEAITKEGKQWLKSYEVRQMLGISDGTLKAMRLSHKITFTKLGGLIFYKYDDIIKLMAPVAKANERQKIR
jgi:hypothetical protein